MSELTRISRALRLVPDGEYHRVDPQAWFVTYRDVVSGLTLEFVAEQVEAEQKRRDQ